MADVMADGEPRRATRMDPDATYRFRTPPHELNAFITPNADLFVLAHFGVPRVEPADWRLEISGLVRHPSTLTFADILRFPKREVQCFLKCAGWPANPRIATRDVSNAVWAGADLATVLAEAGLEPEASFIWSYGLDHGVYEGWRADVYVKDLPVERLRQGDVLLAYEVNGEPLTAHHGYPLRLLIPGYYGTNSVKWLSRIVAADRRAETLFTTELYNDPVPPEAGGAPGETRPAWRVPPDALIVHPGANAELTGQATEIRGWAWAADGIAFVEVSPDGGTTWHRAETGPRTQYSWQEFRFAWVHDRTGAVTIMARATDVRGESQPLSDARNACHALSVTVRSST